MLPIRKISPERVALTTYYGKTYINRGRTVATDYGLWLKNQVMKRILNKEHQVYTDPVLAEVFDPDLKAPRNYTAIAANIKSFWYKNYYLNFDHTEVVKKDISPDVVKALEIDGNLILGWNKVEVDTPISYLVIDKKGGVYTTVPGTYTLEPQGLLENFLDIETNAAPVEYVSVNIFGKSVPIGIILGMDMGLHNLLDLLKVTPRIINAGEKVKLEHNEYALSFSDETLVFNRDNKLASIILSGFNEYSKSLKSFSVYSFDKIGVYVNLLDTSGLSTKYVREIKLMYDMFVDPISLEILKEMKEPTTFKGLLFRASQMLLSDAHPNELDPAYMRIKGYERISGAIYAELIQSIRVHNGKPGKGNAQIEMNPYAVWKRITEDPAKTQVQEINPIKAIKEAESATFAGTGGRNKRSMTKLTRVYHPNDMGTISESTVDSSDVGVNINTSANPQFTSLRGMSGRFNMAKQGATALLSTSALLAPGSDHDD